jgi:hypothetical protein
MRRVLAWLACVAASVVLVACSSGSSPGEAPAGVTVTPGDSSATVSWTSQDGLTYWIFYAQGTSIEYASRTTQQGYRSIYEASNPQVVGGLLNGTPYAFIVAASKDGSEAGPTSASVTVTPRPAGATWSAGTPLPVASLNGVAFGGTLFVAVGAGGAVFTSPDAITWTAQVSKTTNDLNAVRYINGRFIAVGTGGAIINSTDGVSWQVASSATSNTLNGLGDFGGVAVAVGEAGTILVSGEGQIWSAAASGTTNTLYAADGGNGRMVVAGAAGTLLFSDDPISVWQAGTSPVAADLRGVRFGANVFSVVGDGGAILWSADGATFGAAATPASVDLRAVGFGSQFAAVGAAGAVFTSADGITWVAASSGSAANLTGLVFGLYRFSAVGASGANLTAL